MKCCILFLVVFLSEFCIGLNIKEVESEFSRTQCSESQTFEERIRSASVVVVGRVVKIYRTKRPSAKAQVEIEEVVKGGDVLAQLQTLRSERGRQLVLVEGMESPEFCSTEVKEKERKIWLLKKGFDQGELVLDSSLVDFVAENVQLLKAFKEPTKTISSQTSPSKHGLCNNVRCDPFPKCSAGRCRCISCLDEYKPVCGTDGRTYANDCYLWRDSCMQNRTILVQHTGLCEKPQQDSSAYVKKIMSKCGGTNCPFYATCHQTNGQATCRCPNTCSQIGTQVCGTDAITYSNQCYMERTSCLQKRLILVQSKGPCDPCRYKKCEFHALCIVTSQGKAECRCPDPQSDCQNEPAVPVCGSNGISYPSECHLRADACRKMTTTTAVQKGVCPKADPCEHMWCGFGSRCVTESNGLARCSCDHLTCTHSWPDMVCADNGDTFSNECFLRRAQCEKRRRLKVLYKGACDRNPCAGLKCPQAEHQCRVDTVGQARCVCPDVCPAVMVPVCGSDNVTYDSTCHLRRSACLQRNSIYVLHKGKCSEEPRCRDQGVPCAGFQVCSVEAAGPQCLCPDKQCPEESLGGQVCASDSVTYRSECHLRVSACRLQQHNLVVKQRGPCDACRTHKCKFYAKCKMNRFGDPECLCPTDCPYNREHVCGSDGQTYETDCFLKVKSCSERREITVVARTPCRECKKGCPLGQMCRNGKCVCRKDCPKMTMKLCGTDGKYYRNECELKRMACLRNQTIAIDMDGTRCHEGGLIADGVPKDKVQPCKCNVVGAKSPFCNYFGQCDCKPNVFGVTCDRCRPNSWGIQSGSGCTDCSCHRRGSIRRDCDQTSGQCVCKEGVIGQKCDVCPGDYTLTENGCKSKSTKPTTPKQSGLPKTCLLHKDCDFTENSQCEYGLCQCKPGFTFTKDMTTCEVTKGFGFEALSSAQMKRKGLGSRFFAVNISLTLRATEGALFYHGQFEHKDFFALGIKNGFVEFRYDLGSGAVLLKSVKPLDQNSVHIIYADRRNRKGRLLVDNQLEIVRKSPGRMRSLDIPPTLYLGKLPKTNNATLSHTGGASLGFSGCLHELTVQTGKKGRHTYDFRSGKDRLVEKVDRVTPNCLPKGAQVKEDLCRRIKPCRNGGQCINTQDGKSYLCACPLGRQGKNCEINIYPMAEFRGSSYLRLPLSRVNMNKRITVELSFLTTSMTGLLSLLSERPDGSGQFLSISLFNGRVQVSSSSPQGKSTLRSSGRLSLNHWHRLVVRQGKKYLTLEVDGQKKSKTRILRRNKRVVSRTQQRWSERSMATQHIYLGGYPFEVHLPDTLGTSVWMRGAVQKVVVNNVVLPLSPIKGGPYPGNVTQWQGGPCGPTTNPCRGSQLCTPQLDRAQCVCPAQGTPGYSPDCEHKAMMADKPADGPVVGSPNGGQGVDGTLDRSKLKGQSGVSVNFNGHTYLKYRNLVDKRDRHTKSNNIRLRFKTNVKNGLLLLMKKTYSASDDFLVIAVRDGYQEFAVNLGGPHALLRIRAPIRVDDNKWHTVQVLRSGRKATLLVDYHMVSGDLKSADETLDTDGWLWLGGSRVPMSRFPWHYRLNFIGCVNELFIQETPVQLIDDAKRKKGSIRHCANV